MRRLLNRLTITAVFVASCTLGCWAEPGEIVQAGELRLVTPDGWYVAGAPADMPYVCAMLASDDPASEQAILLISKLPKQGRSLASLVSMYRRYIVMDMDGVVEYERAGNIAGCPSHTFVYEGRSEYSSLGRRKFMRAIVEKDGDFYVLHGVADHIPFSKHAGTLESMINSVFWNHTQSESQ